MSPAHFWLGPFLAWPARGEVLLQEIRRNAEDVVTVGRALELPRSNNLNVVLAHQTPDATLADPQAHLIQFLGHARPAIAAKAQTMLIADMGQEHHVPPLPMRRRPMRRRPVLPSPQAAFCHAHQTAQMTAYQAAAILGNILKLNGF